MSIRKKITIAVILIVTIFAVTITGVSVIQFYSIGNNIDTAGETTFNAVSSYTQETLDDVNTEIAGTISTDISHSVQENFDKYGAIAIDTASYVSGLYNGEIIKENPTPLLTFGINEEDIQGEAAHVGAVQEYLNNVGFSSNLEYVNVYYATESGIFFLGNKQKSDNLDNTDFRQRSWYKGAKESSELFWTTIYKDIITEENIITCSYPVYIDQQLMGVVGIDIPISSLSNTLFFSYSDNITNIAIIDENADIVISKEDTAELTEYLKTNKEYIKESVSMVDNNNYGLDTENPSNTIAILNTNVQNWTILLFFKFENIKQSADKISDIVTENNDTLHTKVNHKINLSMTISILFMVLAIIVTVIIIRGITKRLAEPIEKLEDMAKKVGEGDLNQQFSIIKTGDETEKIATAFNNMVVALKAYIGNLEIATAEKERVKTELDVASSIQKSMLPAIFPPFPMREDFDIYAIMQPAKEVGGDFYDFFLTDENHLAIVVADVSGKGIGAALFMVIAKTLIKNEAQAMSSPAEIFTKVNSMLCENNDAEMFVTAFMGILEIDSGKFVCVNAGHNPPALINTDGTTNLLKIKKCMVLAGFEGVNYEEETIEMKKGQRLFLYTDGVTEAFSENDEEYGTPRMVKTLTEIVSSTNKISEIISLMYKDVQLFAKNTEQADDITMVVLEYNDSVTNDSVGYFSADLDTLELVNDFIKEKLESANIDLKLQSKIMLVAEEIFVNIINYAYGKAKGDVSLYCNIDNNYIVLEFRDKGLPFDPTKTEDPDITLSVEERECGGLGIFLTKKFMTSLTYKYANGFNILRMEKKIVD